MMHFTDIGMSGVSSGRSRENPSRGIDNNERIKEMHL
jgi:hypothetical protein